MHLLSSWIGVSDIRSHKDLIKILCNLCASFSIVPSVVEDLYRILRCNVCNKYREISTPTTIQDLHTIGSCIVCMNRDMSRSCRRQCGQALMTIICEVLSRVLRPPACLHGRVLRPPVYNSVLYNFMCGVPGTPVHTVLFSGLHTHI